MAKKFELGEVVTTPRIRDKMKSDALFNHFVLTSLGRFKNGDWGECEPDDWLANADSVVDGNGRVFAKYKWYGTDDVVWIITEADHSVTTVLFPDEY